MWIVFDLYALHSPNDNARPVPRRGNASVKAEIVNKIYQNSEPREIIDLVSSSSDAVEDYLCILLN